VDKPRQNHARQERLARAGGAKNSGAALDELIQVQADRVPLFAGVADAKHLLVVFLPEYLGDISGVRQHHRRVVAGHGFDGNWFAFFRVLLFPQAVFFRPGFRPALHHQHRHHRSLCSSAKRGLVEPNCRSVTRP